VATLKEQIQEAAMVAEEVDMSDDFNAMSWLDLLIEESPETFDSLFDTTWNELSDKQRLERATALREVL
jgi:4-oxalocrotonate tautomerase